MISDQDQRDAIKLDVDLIDDDRGEIDAFLELSSRTREALPRAHIFNTIPIPLDPRSASNPAAALSIALSLKTGIPDFLTDFSIELASGWVEWVGMYDNLVARNPRLEMHGIMTTISEAYDASSYPHGWEDDILAWSRGDRSTMPRHLMTNEIYAILDRLCDITPH